MLPTRPGGGRVLGQEDGVLEVEDPGGGDGVGVVAAPGGIGDDLLDGGAVEAEGDVGPVAAGVLGDEDLAGAGGRRGADVDEVAQVADALRGAGVGAPKARAKLVLRRAGRARQPKVAGVPMSNQVSPWFGGLEDVAGARADEHVLAVDRVDDDVRVARGAALIAVMVHCGSGAGSPLLAWSSPKVRPMPLTMDEIGVDAALAGGPVLVERCRCPAGRRRCRRRW